MGPGPGTLAGWRETWRYDAESLHNEFGTRFHLLESSKELHQTPIGIVQQFLYCLIPRLYDLQTLIRHSDVKLTPQFIPTPPATTGWRQPVPCWLRFSATRK